MGQIKSLKNCIFLFIIALNSVEAQENTLSEQFVNPERLYGRSIFVTQQVPYGLSNKYYYDIVEATLGTKIISPPVSIKAIEAGKVNISDIVEERFITSEEGLNNLNKRRVIIEWDLKRNNEFIADGEYLIRIYVTKGKLKDIDSPEFVHKVTIIRKPTEFDIEFANFDQNFANTEFVVIQKTPGSALVVKAVNEGVDVKANKWSVAIKNMETGKTEYSQDIKAPILTQNINLEYAWYDFPQIEDYDIEHPYTIIVRNEDSAGNSFEQSKPFSIINASELSDALAQANGELEFYRRAIDIKESEYREQIRLLNDELDTYRNSIVDADSGVSGRNDDQTAAENNYIFYHIQIYSRNGNNNPSHFSIDESHLVESEGYYEYYHKTTGYAFFVYATRGNYNVVSAPSHFTKIFDWSGFSHKALEVLVEKAVIQTLLTRKDEVIKLQAVLKNKLVIPRELSVQKPEM